MMASQMDWTAELGQAFVNDQQGVMDAVQRLRAQAKDVGNLQSSEQLKVATETQDGHEVITVSPPSPQVVYVPQYDPVAVYAPAPATVPAPTPVAQEDKGHSTGSLVTTGLLSFGAGILVANIFEDDDDDYYKNGYYNPRYYGPPMPYHPPYPIVRTTATATTRIPATTVRRTISIRSTTTRSSSIRTTTTTTGIATTPSRA